jgi:hypothetical protein
MKKIVLLLFVIALSTTLYGQVELKPGIGLTISNVSKDPD